MCHEQFECNWNEEDEQWVLKNAIRANGTAFHPICHEDYKGDDHVHEENMEVGESQPNVLTTAVPPLTQEVSSMPVLEESSVTSEQIADEDVEMPVLEKEPATPDINSAEQEVPASVEWTEVKPEKSESSSEVQKSKDTNAGHEITCPRFNHTETPTIDENEDLLNTQVPAEISLEEEDGGGTPVQDEVRDGAVTPTLDEPRWYDHPSAPPADEFAHGSSQPEIDPWSLIPLEEEEYNDDFVPSHDQTHSAAPLNVAPEAPPVVPQVIVMPPYQYPTAPVIPMYPYPHPRDYQNRPDHHRDSYRSSYRSNNPHRNRRYHDNNQYQYRSAWYTRSDGHRAREHRGRNDQGRRWYNFHAWTVNV